MSLTSADLVIYSPVNRPLNDLTIVGGAIDTKVKILSDIVFDSLVNVVSSSALDSSVKTLRVVGRGFNGTELTEDIKLNGTTPVVSKIHFDIITDIHLSSDASGSISITTSVPTTFATISAGSRGWTSLFKYSHPRDGAEKTVTRYEKFFVKNTNGSFDCIDPVVTITNVLTTAQESDDAEIKIGWTGSYNDSLTSANRITAPTGVTFVSLSDSLSLSTTLTHGSYVGLWLKITLSSRLLLEDYLPFNLSGASS